MDDETRRDIPTLVKTNAQGNNPELNIDDFKFDRGLTYDWGARVFPERDEMLEGGTWLQDQKQAKDSSNQWGNHSPLKLTGSA